MEELNHEELQKIRHQVADYIRKNPAALKESLYIWQREV